MKTLEQIFQEAYGTEDDLRYIMNRMEDFEVTACIQKYEAQFSEKNEKMIDFILDIDWMTTTEFCNTHQIPLPDIRLGANAYLQIDAIKHKMFVEKAKELRRDKK